MVTVKDIARRANVSPGTVSNYLTGNRPVSEDTSQRIQQAINQLGYQPNMLARSLINQRTQTLGVIVSGLEYYGASRMLVGLEREASRLGYSVQLRILEDPFVGDPRPLIQALQAHRVDGLIINVPEIGGNYDWMTIDYLAQLPPLMCMSAQLRPGAGAVDVDNLAGSQLAMRHLLHLGRRMIGFIGTHRHWSWFAAEQRRTVWQYSLESAGLQPKHTLMADGDWSAVSGECALHQLLEHHPNIDAVFAANDQMATGVLHAAHRLGRRVPDDLAVVGYDDLPEASYLWPSLTTIHQDLSELGRLAVQNLHPWLEPHQTNSKAATHVHHIAYVQPELMVRESTMNQTIRLAQAEP